MPKDQHKSPSGSPDSGRPLLDKKATRIFLTPREHEALRLVQRFGYLTSRHIEAFIFDDHGTEQSRRTMTKRILRRLRESGAVERTPRIVTSDVANATGYAYSVRRAGRPAKGVFHIQHSLAVADLALAFRTAAQRREHELASFETDASFGEIRPDGYAAYLTPTRRYHFFVEVDLGSATTHSFREKVRRYVRLYRSGDVEPWPKIVVAVPDQNHETLLRNATESVKPPKDVVVFFATFSRIQQDALGPIWAVAGYGDQRFPLIEEEK